MTQTADLGVFEQRRYEQLRLADTARNIGHAAVKGYERRRYDEITSGLAEALSGRIETCYPFELKEGRLVAEDGEPIEPMYRRALKKDEELAAADGFYSFLPKRTRAELDNFRLSEAMARGETGYNTLLEISPYSEEFDTDEAAREKLVKAAQKPYWGRTMVRLSHWDGQRLHILTMSSDNLPPADSAAARASSVSVFKQAVRNSTGYEFKAKDSTEMLAEPVTLNVAGSWREIARSVVGEADRVLAARYGGRWQQGRPEAQSIDLQGYVESQGKVLEGLFAAERRLAASCLTYEDYDAAFKRELRNCAALLESRLEQGRQDEEITDYQAAADGAGAWADAQGKTYDMCGLLLEPDAPETAQKLGSESLLRLMNKKIHCPECLKEVVVPEKDLKNGKLSCAECGYWVDVCSGGKGFAKKTAEKAEKTGPSGLDIIAGWFSREKQQRQLRKQAEKQACAELGSNVRYLDIKRYEKRLQQQVRS